VTSLYEIFIETYFPAAHHLRGYDGDCAEPHGHNWVVEVYIQCKKLNNIGIGVDFRDVKRAVKNILSRLDHTDLNELPEFAAMNPSSENIAAYVYGKLNDEFQDENIRVSKVRVSEGPNVGVYYWED